MAYHSVCLDCYPLARTPQTAGAQWCEHRGWHEISNQSLNNVMDFDHVIEVREHGEVVEPNDIYAPELHDGELDQTDNAWSLVNGFSGQDRYAGPIMHASEYVGGGLERYILNTPGLYVVLVDYPTDGSEPDGWAIATREVE